jgi:hypothetical protein
VTRIVQLMGTPEEEKIYEGLWSNLAQQQVLLDSYKLILST